MDFPAWVPECVRQHVRHYLEGDGRGYDGMLAYRDRCRERMERAATALEANELRDRLAHVQDDIDTIVRLVQDARMAGVYAALEHEFAANDDSLLAVFDALRAAAGLDYAEYRERMERAQTLRDEIAKAARRLADLLRKAEKLPVCWPSEMVGIHALLGKVCERFPRSDASSSCDAGIIELLSADADVRFIRGPSVGEAMDVLAHVVEQYNFAWEDVRLIAIASRKRSRKFEYLRAVVWLACKNGVEWKSDLSAPLATAASVVLGEDCTADDVRKAAARVQEADAARA